MHISLISFKCLSHLRCTVHLEVFPGDFLLMSAIVLRQQMWTVILKNVPKQIFLMVGHNFLLFWKACLTNIYKMKQFCLTGQSSVFLLCKVKTHSWVAVHLLIIRLKCTLSFVEGLPVLSNNKETVKALPGNLESSNYSTV